MLFGRAADPDRSDRHGLAIRAAFIYLLAGITWVLLSDLALYHLVKDPMLLGRLETAKGWMFVGGSALAVFLLTARAVARHQRTEATMNAVVESIADGVLLVGRDRTIVDANPAAVRMLGVKDRKELLGMGPEEFGRRFHLSYDDGRIVAADDFVSQRALRGESTAPYKAILYPSPERKLVVTSTAAPVRCDPDGGVDLVVSVMRDQTDLERLEQMRDEFFAAAAHSLKTPIAVIKGHAQLLLTRTDSEGEREAARAIDRQCDRLDRLVQNLLVVTRLRSGLLQFHPREVELEPIVTDVVQQMREATIHHAIVEERTERTSPVFLDGERFALALRNLVDLAFQHAPRGTAVTLLLGQRGDRARVGVRSQRLPGLAAAVPAMAFEGAVHSTDVDGYAGLRVGQQVSAELVKSQGGKLTYEVAPAGASTTWMEFPVVQEERGAR